MSALAHVQLADVAIVLNGKTPSREEQRDTGHPVLKIKDTDEFGKFRGRHESFVENSFAESYRDRCVNFGDTLILNAAHNSSHVASKTYSAEQCVVGALATGEWLIVRPKTNFLEPSFLSHWINLDSTRHQLRLMVKGIHLYPKDVARLQVSLPSLAEQRRIAAILDQADALRTKRRAALANLSEMAQAIFIEMFGDPERNPKQLETVELGQIIDHGPQNGIYKPASFYGEGTPIVRIDTFYNGSFTNIGNLKRLRLSKSEENTYGLRESDIVINRVNSDEYLGKSAIVPSLNEATVFESNMMRLSLKRSRAEPVYVIHALQNAYTKKQIRAAAKDAVNQSSINQKDVACFRLLCPPLDQQRTFVERVALVERVRKEQERAAIVYSSLFASLQYRAFTGAL